MVNEDPITVEAFRTDNNGIGWNLWGMGSAGDCFLRNLHTDLVPEVLLKKRVERDGSTLNDERLDLV